MNPRALIIDDELQIRRLLRVALESAGYTVFEADSGQAGITEAAHVRPDVILLDMKLSDGDGMEVLKHLREWSETPIVVVSVRNSDRDKVDALDAGAEDYVSKPFSMAELMARIRAAQRKVRSLDEEPLLVIGDLTVNLALRRVLRAGKEIRLTPVEYALLRLLVRYAGRVLTHRQILRSVWGPNAEEHRLYLRVYINHLRKKIEPDPARPSLIQTEYGVGYRFALLGGEEPSSQPMSSGEDVEPDHLD
ncbi:MAG: DNA-binding response regulator in two-component regulatory system with KdpD [Verrucomicrobiota bacterium]|jgi:two-component system KDP operon response regulator KdpE